MPILHIKKNIDLPSLPNFLFSGTEPNRIQYSVADLSDEDLEILGKAWTAALIEHAQKKRANR